MTRPVTIDGALRDPNLLGAALGDASSWSTWFVVLKAAFGLPLNAEQQQVFNSVAGNRKPPLSRVRELWAIIGRRGGKSRVAAALAVFFACFVKHKLAAGERGMVLVLAASQEQARTVFAYALAFLKTSPVLSKEIASATRGEIVPRNGIVIAIHTNSFRTIRGRTLCACIFDEIAFWRDETSATPDTETYTAVLPSLATTGGMLIGISSPYRKVGLLHGKHKQYFGVDGDDVLVVQGSSQTFNPSLTDATIDAQRAADPTAAASEWDALFRVDLVGFFGDVTIDRAVDHNRPLELPALPHPAFYRAFVDAAGGAIGGDSYSICIAHKEDERFVVDVVRGRPGPFDPAEVTREFSELCKEYRIESVIGDLYGHQWVQQAWLGATLE